MSINDDALDDLDNEGKIDEDVIKTPSDVATGQDDVTVIVKTDDIKEDVTELNQIEMDQLMQSNVQFQVLTDQVSKVDELESIQDELIAAESIDKSTAKYIGEYFPIFTRSRITLEQYSQTPTKINYQETLKQMKLAIEEEKTALMSNLSTFIATAVLDNQKVLHRINYQYLPDLIQQLTDFREEAKGVLAYITDNKDTVIEYRDDGGTLFIDIAKIDIREFDFAKVRINGDQCGHIAELLCNVQHCLKTRDVASLVVAAEEEMPLEEAVLELNAIQNSLNSITFASIATFFVSDSLIAYLETLSTEIDKQLQVIDKFKSTVDEADDNYDTVIKAAAILQNHDLSDTIEWSIKYAAIIFHTGNLLFNTREIFNFLLRL